MWRFFGSLFFGTRCSERHLKASQDFHLKACRRRFSQRESQRPEEERCPLLAPEDVPFGRPAMPLIHVIYIILYHLYHLYPFISI